MESFYSSVRVWMVSRCELWLVAEHSMRFPQEFGAEQQLFFHLYCLRYAVNKGSVGCEGSPVLKRAFSFLGLDSHELGEAIFNEKKVRVVATGEVKETQDVHC